MEKQAKPKSKFDVFFDNRTAKVIFGLICLLGAYIFASWAIDSGSLLDYAIAFLFLVVGVRELVEGFFKKRRQS